MKRTLLLVLAIAAFGIASATAQTATGNLTVTATVTGSIGFAFSNATGGPALAIGNPANTATLAFGTVSATQAPVTTNGITFASNSNSFTLSAPIDITVTDYNYKSGNYTLTAQLAAADPINDVNTWTVNGITLNSTTPQQITATGGYNTPTQETIALTVPFAANSGTAGQNLSINNTINYNVTAN